MWWLLSHDPAWSPTPLVAHVQLGGPTISSAGCPVARSLISLGAHWSANEQDAPPIDWTVYCVPLWPAMLQCALTVPHILPAEAAPPNGTKVSPETRAAKTAIKSVQRPFPRTILGCYPRKVRMNRCELEPAEGDPGTRGSRQSRTCDPRQLAEPHDREPPQRREREIERKEKSIRMSCRPRR